MSKMVLVCGVTGQDWTPSDQPWHHALRDDGVQSGGYVGEGDIVRFEDAYGRDTLSLSPQ